MSDPKISRRMSRSSDEPYLYESFSNNDAEGKQSYTKSDCLRLAKTITDITQVPVPCQEVVKNEQAMRKAFEGATVTDRARQAIASRKGSVSHHQMQRRLTRTSEAMAR